jgi:hypothetical protein
MREKTKLYLFKLFNNGDFSIFTWSPILAKKGYTVMTPEQAAPYIKLAGGGKANTKYVKDKTFINTVKNVTEVSGKSGRKLAQVIEDKRLEDLDNTSTKEIIDGAVNSDLKAVKIDDDEVRELVISQESIQIKETNYLKSLQHKSTLENHMLEKYQCEIPVGRLDTMRAMANSMISDLAKEGRLYLVDGQVAIK